MYHTFACAQCSKSLRVREEYVGRRIACPHCGAAMQVPRPAPESEADSLELNLRTEPARGGPAGTASAGVAAPASGKSRTAAASTSTSTSTGAAGTDVSLLSTAGMGLVLTLAMYGCLFPLPQASYLRQLFYDRQWVPPTEAYLFWWSIAILIMKWFKVRLQQQATLFDMLPGSVGREITIENLPQFAQHLHSLPGKAHQSFLWNRVLRGLEHFRVRRSASEVATILSSQGEIDSTAVDSSYSLVKVFIWAIPILGFIGTVQGLGAAVSGFSSDLSGAKDISVVKDSLSGITVGLGVAFDTTLIALVMSVLLMFPMSALHKQEDDLLNSVNEYCNENLLKRLSDGQAGDGGSDVVIRRAIANAMAGHHAELTTWARKLEQLGEALTRQVSTAWGEVHAQEQAGQAERLAAVDAAAHHMVERQQDLLSQFSALQAEVAQLQERQAQEAASAAASLAQCLGGLERGLAGLNGVLGELGQKQVTIVQHVAAPARGWWPFAGRRGSNHGQT